jgi:hypothetical protein
MQYGITSAERDTLIRHRDGKCWICKNRPAKMTLNADHSHDTGVLRGFLCMTCNKGLAMFRDDPGLLNAAAEYIHSASREVADLLGYQAVGRTGRSGRKWRTKRERRERLAWVESRLVALGYTGKRGTA